VELRQLRYFVAVAEELHFRRAAERLHMSQPPLSQAIRQLEGEVGAELLLRNRRRVELTPAGAAFLDEARAILAAADGAAETARRTARGELGRLAIGFVGSAMYGRLPEVLREFRAAHPGVDLRLSQLTTPAQVEALHHRRIELGVLRLSRPEEDLELTTLARERVVVALPAGHALARKRSLPLEALSDEPLVLLSRREAPGLRDAIARAVAVAGGSGHVVQEVGEMQTVIGLVAAGLGISFVPESVAAAGRHDVTFRALQGEAPTVELSLAWRRGERGPLLDAFLETATPPEYVRGR
jgi:DNA-binding transcriptional LysR family regulator